MRRLMTGLMILMAGAALLAAGCDSQARAPKEWVPREGDADYGYQNVVEVVVTGERPAWLMPEVVVNANSMPEVVVYASWSPTAVVAASPQASFVN